MTIGIEIGIARTLRVGVALAAAVATYVVISIVLYCLI